ncbi:MAG: M56 family metallopeptidase [Janthinobacterium lividum]
MTTLRLLENWLSPALVRALGYALLHSLWQGAGLAGLLAAALPLLRRHRPEVRYAASAAALAGLLLAVGGTFGYYYSQAPASRPLPMSLSPRENAVVASILAFQTETSSQALAPPTPLAALAHRAEPYLPLLVAAWLLGLLLMAGRLAGGLFYAGRLRRAGTQALGAEWQQRLAALATRVGLRRPVALLESGRVRGPLVLGYLRPAILLPLGAVAGLPPALLEALLAHELAHIVRRDYLLNLALAATEAVFFYHPAVWFMAGCLRAERENCCDDQAATLCGGDALRVARALAALAELEASTAPVPRLALAAAGTGGRGSLLARVRRLALGRPQAPTLTEGLLAGLLCLLGVAGLGTGLAMAAPVASKAPRALLATIKQTIAPADTAHQAKAGTATVTITTATTAKPLRKQAQMTVVATGDADLDAADEPRLRRLPRSPRQGRPSTVVLEKDKKGRVVSLTVDGQPIETAATGKKAKRNKQEKVRTVEVVTVPNNQVRLERLGAFRFPRNKSTESEQLKLAELLSNSSLTIGQRQDIARELLRLREAGANTGWQYGIAEGDDTSDAELDASKGNWQTSKQFGDQLRTFQFRLQDNQQQMQEGQRRLREGQRQLQKAQRQFQLNLNGNVTTNLNGLAELNQADRDADQADRNATQAQRNAEQAGRNAEQAARNAKLLEINTRRAELRARMAADAAELRALSSAGREELVYSGPTTAKLPRPPRAPLAPPAPPAPQEPAMPHLPPPPPPAPNTNRLREELRRDGLISDEKHFSFELNDEGGRANGKALTPDQVAKYRKLFNQPAASGKGKTKSTFQKSTFQISVNEN